MPTRVRSRTRSIRSPAATGYTSPSWNATLRVPADALIELVVRPGFGAADDWTAERAGRRCRHRRHPIGCPLLGKRKPLFSIRKGRLFTDNDIGEALAVRNLLDELRQGGNVTGGPASMTPKDRSRFLSKLDELVNAVRRACPGLE